MEVNGQLLAPATSSLEDQPPAPTVYKAGWAQNSCVAATERKKYFAHVRKKLLFLTAQHS
jgi:hypothetical protein